MRRSNSAVVVSWATKKWLRGGSTEACARGPALIAEKPSVPIGLTASGLTGSSSPQRTFRPGILIRSSPLLHVPTTINLPSSPPVSTARGRPALPGTPKSPTFHQSALHLEFFSCDRRSPVPARFRCRKYTDPPRLGLDSWSTGTEGVCLLWIPWTIRFRFFFRIHPLYCDLYAAWWSTNTTFFFSVHSLVSERALYRRCRVWAISGSHPSSTTRLTSRNPYSLPIVTLNTLMKKTTKS
jgi:hypothetical protein